jgi:hypothetical protein
MAITLPDGIVPNGAEPFLVEFGGVMQPFLGGPAQMINRMGTRLGVRFTIPPTVYADKGMALISRLMRAKSDRLVTEWHQPGFAPGTVGVPLVAAAVSGGTTLQIKGLPAGKVVREGQFLSVVRGSRYLHSFAADGAADGSGNLSASVWPPIRTLLLVNDAIEIATPQIEGHVSPGDELNWRISVERLVDVSFSVVESK